MKKIVTMFFLLSAGIVFPEEPVTAPDAQFAAARQAYDEGRHADALALYDQLLGQHWFAPELYFNRGNALARLGQTGNAVASYEMALLLNPRDADAAANLKFIRLKAGLPTPEQNIAARLLGQLTKREWFLAVQIAWWLAAILLAGYWIASGRPPWLRQGAMLCFVVLAIALTGFGFAWRQQRYPAVVVTQPGVQALFAPLAGATPHFDTPEGITLRLVEQTGDWVRVRSGTRMGWLPATACCTVRIAQ